MIFAKFSLPQPTDMIHYAKIHIFAQISTPMLKNTIQSANYEQEKHYFYSVKPTMAKAELDKRKKGSRRSKDAKRLKWRERVKEYAIYILCALAYCAVYFPANTLIGSTIVRGEINENTFLLFMILPVLLLPIRSWLSGVKDWSSLIFNAILGWLAGTVLFFLSITVWLGLNYLIPSSEPYERMAVVGGMREENRYRQAAHNYINLHFTDNGEWYKYDGSQKEYDCLQPGDTCIVTVRDGLWGYPVITNLQPTGKSQKPHRDIRSLLELLKEDRMDKNSETNVSDPPRSSRFPTV